jgi:hypothetical protein
MKGAEMSDTMMVNVNDLVVDMPVSEEEVQRKMESMNMHGLVQPLTVWLKDMRIIDGFHRLEAAKRLGWTEIECVVRDYTEEAFWDARIQSAKQHHEIEEDRLVTWMVNCWKVTKWGNAEHSVVHMAKEIWDSKIDPKQLDPVFLSMFGRSQIETPVPRNKTELGPEQAELFAWLTERSAQWGIGLYRLVGLILSRIKWIGYGPNSSAITDIARKHALSLEERVKLGADVSSSDLYSYRPTVTYGDIDSYIKAGKVGSGTLQAYADERQKQQRELEADLEREREGFRHAKYLTEKSDSEVALHRLQCRLKAFMLDVDDYKAALARMPSGAELLSSVAEYAIQTIKELWPETETPELNPIILENARLRGELEAERGERMRLEWELKRFRSRITRVQKAVVHD